MKAAGPPARPHRPGLGKAIAPAHSLHPHLHRRAPATRTRLPTRNDFGHSSAIDMAPPLRTDRTTMKLRPLDSPSDAPDRTARVLRDPHRGCFVLLGRHALLASDHALNRFEVTSATDAERDALLRARTRLRGLRPRLVPLTHEHLPHGR